MSSFNVFIETIDEINPIPGADQIELAKIRGYRAVVPVGQYKAGDHALYIPEAAVLPDSLIENLGLVGRLAGKDKNRVKAIRLRGVLSQGIVCRPSQLWDKYPGDVIRAFAHNQTDMADELGIVKWVPIVPAQMAGEVEPAPSIIPMIDIENVKKFPNVFEEGEEVVVTEKIHGTCTIFHFDVERDQFQVSSKGLAQKHLALKESDTNLYWRMAQQHNVEKYLRHLVGGRNKIRTITVYGETYGPGVQDLGYDAVAGHPAWRMFGVTTLKDDGEKVYFHPRSLPRLGGFFDWMSVPILYRGPYQHSVFEFMAEGDSEIADNIREGLVVTADPPRHSDVLDGPAVVKFISTRYLTRKDGSEYE
jgi:RNA ligase (TIGR02306 family)